MERLTTLSIAMDTTQADKASNVISKLLSKVRQYNDQVEKSNRLLREQEKLRKTLNVRVEKGKTIGLVEDK